MQNFGIKTDVCDRTHSRKVKAKEERPDPTPYVLAAYDCTGSVHGAR